MTKTPAVYPHLTSEGKDELIGWSATSCMVADEDGMIYAVNDSFYLFQPTIFKIDPSQNPAKVVNAIRVVRADTTLPVVEKELVRDLTPDLTSTGGYVLDKVEGLAIQPDGTAWISTDNDGVDDHSGETMFFSIGKM